MDANSAQDTRADSFSTYNNSVVPQHTSDLTNEFLCDTRLLFRCKQQRGQRTSQQQLVSNFLKNVVKRFLAAVICHSQLKFTVRLNIKQNQITLFFLQTKPQSLASLKSFSLMPTNIAGHQGQANITIPISIYYIY